MILSSGKMKVLKNSNPKKTKFFGEVEVGDIIEVKTNLNKHLTYGGGSKMVTVYDLTKNTSRTDAPTYLDSGLDKMVLEPVLEPNEAEYQRGYSEAYNEFQDAYMGGYIEEMFEEEEGWAVLD